MMIRRWTVVLQVLAVLALLPVAGYAAVSGNCSNCHTMHNSEQGEPVAFTRTSAGEVPISAQPNLLRTDCTGCHTDGGANTIRSEGGTRVPIVFNLLEPTYPPDGSATATLAGGNFHWLLNKGDRYGHNVAGIAAVDGTLSHAPGWDVGEKSTCIDCHQSLATAQSGCKGCHVPMHHAGGSGLVTGKEHGWYRFLGSVMQDQQGIMPATQGVVGIEDPDWEQNPAADRHNVYQGKAGVYSGYLDTGAIAQKCAGCHGNFHSNVAEGSTWIRHPIDVAIPNAGEFVAFSDYNPMVPVARATVAAGDVNFAQITRGADMVTCLSCHRPHGSPYPSMLRWGYRDWPGTDSHTNQPAWNGCAVCHTYKD